MTRMLSVLWLTAVWVLLWGEASVANVAAGVVLAVVLTVAFPIGRDRGVGVHPVALLRFGAFFAVSLVQSTTAVAATVVRRDMRLEEGIVEVPLHVRSPLVVSFVANAITLTPGTLTVDVRPRGFGTDEAPEGDADGGVPPSLFVHCLVTGDPDGMRDDAWHLERLAVAAFGTPEDRAALARGGDAR